MLDGTTDYVDDGREIFDEDLDEKPATTGSERMYSMVLCNIKMLLLSTLYCMYDVYQLIFCICSSKKRAEKENCKCILY